MTTFAEESEIRRGGKGGLPLCLLVCLHCHINALFCNKEHIILISKNVMPYFPIQDLCNGGDLLSDHSDLGQTMIPAMC